VSANPNLKEDNNKGEVRIQKTVMLVWDFAHIMWEHWNGILHNTQPSWRLPILWGMPILMMPSLSCMTRWIYTLQRTGVIWMSLWQFNFASHYDHIIYGWLMHVFWCKSQNNKQWASTYFEPILSSPTICEDCLECNAWMDWICLIVLPNEPVEFVFLNAGILLKNNKSLALT
jgi:hypothetical protein